MWTCPNCARIFKKTTQSHSCKTIPLEQHFNHKQKAKELFDYLVKEINTKIGKCQRISIPCCIHLFGQYDFLAILPKKDKLEIRFALNRNLDSQRLKQSVPVSSKSVKYCINLNSITDIDEELIKWLDEAYYLKKILKYE